MTPAEKVALIRDYAGRYPQLRVFVETGLWQGGGSWEGVRDLFYCCYAIDLDESNVEEAIGKGLQVGYVGDSADWLPELLQHLDEPALFWLDAHCMSEYDGEDSCPLLAELAAIVAWPYAADSVVLIDDARLLGRPGYPTHDQLYALAERGYYRRWLWISKDDVIRLTP